MKHFSTLAGAAILALAVATSSAPSFAAKSHNHHAPKTSLITTPDGLQYTDVLVGKGPIAKVGQHVTVTYVGTLVDGKKFDASADHGGGTFTFPLGQGQVIRGWDEGVTSMRVGGKRRLVVPPSLGYGTSGAGDLIPPNSTLIFDITLISVAP